MCPEGAGSTLGCTVRRRAHITFVVLVTIAVAASVAFARSTTTTKPSGTGVVVIDTELAYQGGEAAGTGMVLTSAGKILTNNHVIKGATSIRVVVPSTGRHYTATVVGYDDTDDVAVLQATGASNLRTVSLGHSSNLKLGQRVTAIGNAGGTGRLAHASGKIISRSRSITVSDDNGGSEHLSSLLETSAPLQAGDSGGPLETSTGKVIGMDTAASAGSGFRQISTGPGFAIPINRALTIADQIGSSRSSSKVHIGGTAFLGVSVAPGGPGATIAGVMRGGAADAAGLTAGDTITSIDGRTVSSPGRLTTLLLTKHPGDQVSVDYTDRFGTSHTVTVALGGGPPQ
jgi:S1-C subfamily serine protease